MIDEFNPKEVLAEIDNLLRHCRENGKLMMEDWITDINVKTVNYIKKCKKIKCARHLKMTKKYLKDNNLLAVPFDKGVGICLMSKDSYNKKMDKLVKLPQFQKLEKGRSNAKNPILKEEERVINTLKDLKKKGKIDEKLFDRVKPVGSQPARLYGLAKVHKKDIPMRPVLSMPGSAYHGVAQVVSNWLSVVPECQINCNTKTICDTLKDVNLEEDESIVSFDVSSLYTNVHVIEAIERCADLLFRTTNISVDKETFIELAKIASCNVVMSTHDGFYRQIDGLAMGSAPAPFLANGWLSQFDPKIKDDAKLYFRYMDDIVREIKTENIDQKLSEINSFHPALKFTIEKETDDSLPFLDMRIIRKDCKLSSTWYSKPTDTGLIMNFHSFAPQKYKQSVVSGFVYRIYRSCSSWANFHMSLERAKKILNQNQYPETFFEPIINKTLENIITEKEKEEVSEEELEKHKLFLYYRGKASENFAKDLKKAHAPCRTIFKLRKLKTVLPSLKPPVEKMLKSHVVYQIKCSSCDACYVGQTTRHLTTRLSEHKSRKGPVKEHFLQCKNKIDNDCISVLDKTTNSDSFLLTLEAIWIRDIKPKINTKDEFRSRELIIRI